jgi:hypothetical protein
MGNRRMWNPLSTLLPVTVVVVVPMELAPINRLVGKNVNTFAKIQQILLRPKKSVLRNSAVFSPASQ